LHYSNYCSAGTQETSTTVSSTLPIRVIVHGHHPNENAMEDDTMGKLINLPDSIEDLFRLAGIGVSLCSRCMPPKGSQMLVFLSEIISRRNTDLTNHDKDTMRYP
jgi:hypothetical protein